MKTTYKLLVSFLMVFSCLNVIAQQKPKTENDKVKKDPAASHLVSDTVYAAVEQAPSFRGGEVAMKKAIATKFGKTSIEKTGIKPSRVYVAFTITEKGEITDPKILKGAYPELDAQVLDFVKTMPKWIPARQNGKPTKTQWVYPFVFWIEVK